MAAGAPQALLNILAALAAGLPGPGLPPVAGGLHAGVPVAAPAAAPPAPLAEPSDVPGVVHDDPEQLEIRSQLLFVTYAGLTAVQANKDAFLAKAESMQARWGQLVEYEICMETHNTPADPIHDKHIHAYFRYKREATRRVQIRNRLRTQVLDITAQDLPGVLQGQESLHPEIIRVGRHPEDRTKVILYIRKEDPAPLSRLEYGLEPQGDQSAHRGIVPGWGAVVRDARTADEAEAYLLQHHPNLYYMHFQGQVRPNLKRTFGHMCRPMFELRAFSCVLDLGRNTTYFVTGATGVGKTHWALAHSDYPSHIRRKDDFKNNIGLRTTLVVIDDFDFSGWGYAELCALVDREHDVSLASRYTDGFIKRGMARIICSNLPLQDAFNFAHLHPMHIHGLQRRVTVVNELGSLRADQYNMANPPALHPGPPVAQARLPTQSPGGPPPAGGIQWPVPTPNSQSRPA